MYLTRHTDMIKDVKLDTPILIVGAGSIGSYSALALAKLGFSNMIVMDDGIIEEENIAPQFYRPRDIGIKKVVALKKAIMDQTGTEIVALDVRYDPDTKQLVTDLTKGSEILVISAVDSMTARLWISENARYTSLIDARMAIEFLAIYSVRLGDGAIGAYQQTLHSDADSVQEACTNKAISYTSFIAGGLVAKCVLDRLKGSAPDFQVVNFDINAFDMVRL